MQVTMEAHFALLLAGMGDFHCHPRVVQILTWNCQITPQLNSPMAVLPTIQSSYVRQENMTKGILLTSPSKRAIIHSRIPQLQVSISVYF